MAAGWRPSRPNLSLFRFINLGIMVFRLCTGEFGESASGRYPGWSSYLSKFEKDDVFMRTTLSLDPDGALKIKERLAEEQNVSMKDIMN